LDLHAGTASAGDGALSVGHSLGGVLAPNLAAFAEREGPPRPLAILSVEPGKSWGPRAIQVPIENLIDIPAGTLLVTVAGDRDRLVGTRDAKRIFDEASNVASRDKNFIILHSDDHGGPALVASHIAPTAPIGAGARGRTVDALDRYGAWKLCDGLFDAVFRGTNRRYALGGTPEQRFMGRWSDGVPVKALEVVRSP
jgi:hypothetical protein